MSNQIKQLFTEHPESVNETYLQHLLKASYFSWRLFTSAFVCLIHALLPFLFAQSASSNIRSLYGEMTSRK